jgi:ribosomal protein S18 acetylase RimI-like enzyme
MKIKEFTAADHESAHKLWYGTTGVCTCDKCMSLDTRENVAKYLVRNPGMSFVAYDGDSLVGAVLAGHDGRTGLIYRLTVAESHRERGIGRDLVDASLNALKADGITNVKAFVLNENDDGKAFWEKQGFTELDRATTHCKEM